MNTATFADGTTIPITRQVWDDAGRAPGLVRILIRDGEEFVLVEESLILDGRKLAEDQDWRDIAPELADDSAARAERLLVHYGARRLTLHEAAVETVRELILQEDRLRDYILERLKAA